LEIALYLGYLFVESGDYLAIMVYFLAH